LAHDYLANVEDNHEEQAEVRIEGRDGCHKCG